MHLNVPAWPQVPWAGLTPVDSGLPTEEAKEQDEGGEMDENDERKETEAEVSIILLNEQKSFGIFFQKHISDERTAVLIHMHMNTLTHNAIT